MHDYTGVRLKVQNGENVVFVYELNKYGEVFRTETVESIGEYRYRGFAMMPTYVCECGMEYSTWEDTAEHLALFESIPEL